MVLNFIINLCPADKHPNYYRIKNTAYAYAVNNVPGGVIVLRRNQRYNITFVNNTNSDYKLYLTTDPAGGGFGKITQPISAGTLTITVDDSYPLLFYYNDYTKEFIGGAIIVLDR